MSKIIRWAILGCGRIADKFASDLQLVEEAKLVAIGSRSSEPATAFAAKFAVPFVHNSYEALADDPDVDVIYIATPHNLHCENTLLCLQHQKAVLCEKPFAMNLRQANKMINLARKQNVFLMEALWTKFVPHYIKMMEMIREGELGTVKTVLANFGFKPAELTPQRLFDPALGGGTILDIGIYNVFLALSILGKPDVIEAVMIPATTGVDEQCSVLFRYHDGAMAQLFSSFTTNLPIEASIAGTKASMQVTNRFYEPSATLQFYKESIKDQQTIPIEKETGFGYQYEARHVTTCLQQGLTESPVMTHADTLLLTETLDKIRAIAGIHYATDN
jgi:predicted dehydrogenase